MGKERSEKKEKRVKKEKRSSEEEAGVQKTKKDKKSKITSENVAAAVEEISKVEAIRDEEDAVNIKPIGALVPFAAPLADEKVTKKVLKGVKKAAKNKTLKRGVKEVVKALRKSPLGSGSAPPAGPGVVILAADISPMDVISHIPVLCEDHNVPYIFVTSRAELGAAGNTKRPTSVVMISQTRSGTKKDEEVEDEDEYKEVYKDLVKIVEREGRSVRV